MDKNTEIRLALLWTLLNLSTEIDASTEKIIEIMESIERKIGKDVCLAYWQEYLNEGSDKFEEKMKFLHIQGQGNYQDMECEREGGG